MAQAGQLSGVASVLCLREHARGYMREHGECNSSHRGIFGAACAGWMQGVLPDLEFVACVRVQSPEDAKTVCAPPPKSWACPPPYTRGGVMMLPDPWVAWLTASSLGAGTQCIVTQMSMSHFILRTQTSSSPTADDALHARRQALQTYMHTLLRAPAVHATRNPCA